jgi:restriction system protein
MALPKYDEFYLPLLTALQDGNVHHVKSVKAQVAEILHLSDEALAERLPSGKQTFYNNRFGWAQTYLKKAGLIGLPQKSHLAITAEGQSLLKSGLPITNALLAERYPDFAEFTKRKATSSSEPADTAPDISETPLETLERVYLDINAQLADDLLTEIMNQTPAFFEALVVDLMKAMNYGDGFVTKLSGDGGIDGVIHEDKLGFNLIYIQAKRWEPNITIGKPEIQKFAGAMMGPPKIEKGLFITTAKFSQGAKAFADAQHIILVDGKKLTELMIEYELGVSTQKVYQVKRIDSDYFSED